MRLLWAVDDSLDDALAVFALSGLGGLERLHGLSELEATSGGMSELGTGRLMERGTHRWVTNGLRSILPADVSAMAVS